MTERSHRVSRRSVVLALFVFVLVLMVWVSSYAAHVRGSAQSLINSANRIHSTADAEREIAIWRSRSDRRFTDESPLSNGDRSYTVQVENGLLNRIRIVPPTAISMIVTIGNGQLKGIILVMFTGRSPSTTSGVWVQEYFGSGATNDFHVNPKGRPWKATVDFSSAAPESQREKAFALNTKCFVQPGGCKSAEDILPGVWQWDTAQQSQR